MNNVWQPNQLLKLTEPTVDDLAALQKCPLIMVSELEIKIQNTL